MKSARSAAYPSYTIEYCLDFVERIYKVYGSNYRAQREEIASALNLGVGTLTQKISSSVHYGLLDSIKKKGYMVTNIFVKYYRPIDKHSKRETLIEAFKSPTLYSALIDSFDGNILPPVKPLANILLQKHNISETACDTAAQVFEDNVKYLQLISDERLFSFLNETNVEAEEIEEENEELDSKKIDVASNNSISISNQNNKTQNENFQEYTNPQISSESIPFNIPLKGKKSCTINCARERKRNRFRFYYKFHQFDETTV